MKHIPLLTMKYQILSRRVASLPIEIDAWFKGAETDHTLERNFSQSCVRLGYSGL